MLKLDVSSPIRKVSSIKRIINMIDLELTDRPCRSKKFESGLFLELWHSIFSTLMLSRKLSLIRVRQKVLKLILKLPERLTENLCNCSHNRVIVSKIAK